MGMGVIEGISLKAFFTCFCKVLCGFKGGLSLAVVIGKGFVKLGEPVVE
jgi:hypothetical protein